MVALPERRNAMTTLEKAIQKCFDRCNLDPDGESMDIMRHMYRYKAIRELPGEEFDKVYDELSERLGFRR